MKKYKNNQDFYFHIGELKEYTGERAHTHIEEEYSCFYTSP